MENFVVSARKYRPLGFEEVVGQDHITTTLKNAIDSNKLAQALLFCGPRGVGKTTCARIVARMINGFEEKAEVNSLNIFELDAASNNSVEDIRSLIDQVRYPPQYGKFKVYIIDEVHMLSNAAFNAFLKTLEEPPSYAIFILATTEKHKVIPTILSRCQIFDFNRIQISDIAKQLKKIADREKIKTEEAALHLIAQKADGALRDALSIFDLMVTFSSGKGVSFQDVINNLHILDYEYYFKVVDGLLAENPTVPLLIFDEILRKGFDGQNFIVGLSEHLRNLMVSQDVRTVQLMEVPDVTKKKYIEQSKASPYSLLLSWLSIANQCDIHYKASKNQRLLVELALMKMAHFKSTFNGPAPLLESAQAGLKKIELTKEPQVIAEVPRPSEESTSKSLEKPITQPKIAVEETQKQQPQEPAIPRTPLKGTKAKTSFNLSGLNKKNDGPAIEEKIEEIKEAIINHKVVLAELQEVWNEYAELRKNQVGEYQLLKREFEFDHPTIFVILTNPVEESFIENFRHECIAFLRDRLKNSELTITTRLKQAEGKRIIYTSKEKFEHLAEKNPYLNELKDKLGLDWDF